jgi:hypothetical protein
MTPIVPVHKGDHGSKVLNLQHGLLYLVLHQPGISDNNRKTLQRRLGPEIRAQTFGDATEELVGLWQAQLKNWPDYFDALPKEPVGASLADRVKTLPIESNGRGNGDVDKITAEALNWILRDFGALPKKK